jgi:hypothetical protein
MIPIRYDFERCEEGYLSFGGVSKHVRASMEVVAKLGREGTYFSLSRDCRYKKVIKSRPNPIRHPNTLASDHG